MPVALEIIRFFCNYIGMVTFGLILIVLAWAVQFLLQKNQKITPAFINLYLLGVVLLVVEGFRTNSQIMAYLNLAAFCLAALVLYRTVTKKD